MKKKYVFSILAAITCMAYGSCKKFVDVGQPRNQIVTSEVFADSADANAAILGLYVNIMQSYALGIPNGGMTLYPGLSADEFAQTSQVAVNNEFYANNITTTNSVNNYLWSSAYKDIYIANASMEGIGSSAGISSGTKNTLIAEAKFMRSFLYFYLVNLHGQVPLITGTDYNKNRLTGQSAKDAVYAQIISDLQFGEANLPTDASVNDRATSYAASALLARVYLYQGKYDLALTEATKVIGSGVFNLEPDLNNVFLAASAETIWKLDPVIPGKETWEGYTFVPSGANVLPKYVLTQDLYNSFETGDSRKADWIKVNVVGGTGYPFPYKYKDASTTGDVAEDYVMIRLAELYLIRAEAEADQGDLASAANDLNMIRTRAGLANTTATDKNSMISAIIAERRHEFFCEWGHRWFDMKRLKLADVVFGSKPNWNTTDQLYPVPLTELTNDPNLKQNPGY